MVKKKTPREKVTKTGKELVEREPWWYWHPVDLLRRVEDEFEEFRRNMLRHWETLERAVWSPEFMYRFTGARPFRYGRTLWTPITETREPLVDIEDQGKNILIRAEMPGTPKENIDINVTDDTIEISAETAVEREEREEDYYHRERSYKSFYRLLPLPTEVISNKADATLKDGILEVTIPKKTPEPRVKGYRVKVK